MATTTIRVDEKVRARLAERAKAQGKPMTQVIEEALEAQADHEFWAEYRRTMLTPEAIRQGQEDVKFFDASAKDGLEPEDWSHLR